MKKLIVLYFIFSFLTGTIIYILQKLAIPLPDLINNYINDFFIIPIILTPSLYILKWSKNNPNYTLPISIVLYLCALYAIFFEWYLPKFHERYTADIVDVVLYFASGILFYFLQKR